MFKSFPWTFRQHHILLRRLKDLDVNNSIILWISAFLCDRPQRVSVSGHYSEEITVNTGAPQGCVLSPLLFSIYTNELMCNNPIPTLIKFADDVALIARLKMSFLFQSTTNMSMNLLTGLTTAFLSSAYRKQKNYVSVVKEEEIRMVLCLSR